MRLGNFVWTPVKVRKFYIFNFGLKVRSGKKKNPIGKSFGGGLAALGRSRSILPITIARLIDGRWDIVAGYLLSNKANRLLLYIEFDYGVRLNYLLCKYATCIQYSDKLPIQNAIYILSTYHLHSVR